VQALPDAKVSYKLLAKLPEAAKLYRQQIRKGLDGDPRAAHKARVFASCSMGKSGCSRSPAGAYSRAGLSACGVAEGCRDAW
jgi:hypothetical protein